MCFVQNDCRYTAKGQSWALWARVLDWLGRAHRSLYFMTLCRIATGGRHVPMPRIEGGWGRWQRSMSMAYRPVTRSLVYSSASPVVIRHASPRRRRQGCGTRHTRGCSCSELRQISFPTSPIINMLGEGFLVTL